LVGTAGVDLLRRRPAHRAAQTRERGGASASEPY